MIPVTPIADEFSDRAWLPMPQASTNIAGPRPRGHLPLAAAEMREWRVQSSHRSIHVSVSLFPFSSPPPPPPPLHSCLTTLVTVFIFIFVIPHCFLFAYPSLALSSPIPPFGFVVVCSAYPVSCTSVALAIKALSRTKPRPPANKRGIERSIRTSARTGEKHNYRFVGPSM